MILAFINQYLNYIRWGIVLFGLAASFWGGLSIQKAYDDAGALKAEHAEAKETQATGDKANAVRKQINALPAGAAAIELRTSYSRD